MDLRDLLVLQKGYRNLVEARQHYQNRQDGGPGSGNWGHAGRPGQPGGSAKGGGKRFRLSTPDGGFASLAAAYKENAKHSKEHPEPPKPKEPEKPKKSYEELKADRKAADKEVKAAILKFNEKLFASKEDAEKAFEEYKAAAEKSHAITREMFKSIDDCKDIDDVNAYVKAQGFFKEGISEVGIDYYQLNLENDLSNLSRLEFESAKNVVKAYEKVFDTYPEFKGQFNNVTAKTLSPGVYGDCQTMAGGKANGRIRINSSLTHEQFEKDMAHDVAAHHHPKVSSAYSAEEVTMIHELGHAVDGYISEHYTTHTGSIKTDTFATDALKYASDQLGMTQAATKRSVSNYAKANNREFFAEAFMEAMCSDSPSKAALAVKEYMETTLGGSK